MKYEEIYSRFYEKQTDPSFYELTKEDAYEKMRIWLHTVASIPHVRKCFSDFVLDDDFDELKFELVNSQDEDSDKDFVIEIFAQGMVICWMRPQIEKNLNLAIVVSPGKEKVILNNYKANIARLESLEKNLKKFIRDHSYFNNDYKAGEQ